MIFYVILVKILNILGFSLTFISLFLYFVLGLIANLVFRIWFIYNLIHQLSPSFFCNLVILVPNPEFGRWVSCVVLLLGIDRHVSCFNFVHLINIQSKRDMWRSTFPSNNQCLISGLRTKITGLKKGRFNWWIKL